MLDTTPPKTHPTSPEAIDAAIAQLADALAQARDALEDVDRLGPLAEQIGAVATGPLAQLANGGDGLQMSQAQQSSLRALAEDIAVLQRRLDPRIELFKGFGAFLRENAGQT